MKHTLFLHVEKTRGGKLIILRTETHQRGASLTAPVTTYFTTSFVTL